jgi:hypothetical protein
MRKIKRAPLEVFNLAFLDIISCAFGAVVMLVLLAKNGEQDMQRGPNNLSMFIQQVVAAQTFVEALQGALSDKQTELAASVSKSASFLEKQKKLDASIPRAQKTLEQLKDKAQSLRTEIRLANARLNVANSSAIPDDDVGGIPTDAEYVIFVIDNSGSMSAGASWRTVTNVVSDILSNHPAMKGFQIMAADGGFMYSGTEGTWLPDSPNFRKKAITRMASFTGGSSQPEKGISRAIKLYKKKPGKISLYVFGDDYRQSQLDGVVSALTNQNKNKDGKAIIRIHGIGFARRQGNSQQFAAFMQAIAKRNRGAFVGLNF